jgi:hypothetical protein
MHDNKLRLSADVLEKAEQIAQTWGLKNSRAAVEAVFRKYADEYLYGRQGTTLPVAMMSSVSTLASPVTMAAGAPETTLLCPAVSELDGLLEL